MWVDVRVGFDVDEESFPLQFLEDPIGGCGIDRFLTGEGAEAFAEGAVFRERCDADQSEFSADLMIDVPATRSDVDNPGALASDDVGVAFEVATAVDDVGGSPRRSTSRRR